MMNNNKIEGNYKVEKNEQFNGMITGIVTVKQGTEFANHGTICKDVIVEKDGVFHNHGMVNGSVIGEGYVEIWGMVKGNVSTTLDSYIHKNAVVNGERFERDKKSF